MRTEGGDLAAVKQKLGIADAQFDTFLPLMHLRMWVDALVVKVYGALLPVTISRKMDRSRLSSSNNYDEALKLIEQFNPKHVYFYEMGYEQWLSHLLEIKHQDKSEQISDAGKMVVECQRRDIHLKILYAKDEFVMEPVVEMA